MPSFISVAVVCYYLTVFIVILSHLRCAFVALIKHHLLLLIIIIIIIIIIITSSKEVMLSSLVRLSVRLFVC